MSTAIPRFFMGTSTENGFCGFPRDLFENDPDAHAFFIKSGPGTGKSTLLRSLAAAFRTQGETVEEYACSSDPDSLDGIHLPARRVCVFDATAPHVLEPKRWGLQEEIVSLGDALDVAAVTAHRKEIENAAADNAAAHARARRFLAGATEVFNDRHTLTARALRQEKVQKIANRLAYAEMRKSPYSASFCGKQRRFLTAVTPKGVCSYPETIPLLCPRVIALDDPFLAAAPAVIRHLGDVAEKNGLPHILCPHPLAPDIAFHLLLPSAGVAFVTVDRNFAFTQPTRTLHLRRVYDNEVLKANKNRTAFDKKVEHALLSAAIETLADAKTAHDLLEIPYKSAMDFKKVETAKTALYQRISSFPPRA